MLSQALEAFFRVIISDARQEKLRSGLLDDSLRLVHVSPTGLFFLDDFYSDCKSALLLRIGCRLVETVSQRTRDNGSSSWMFYATEGLIGKEMVMVIPCGVDSSLIFPLCAMTHA